MIAVGVCSATLPEKRTAFRGCYGVGGRKCGAFTYPCVGAYCIRPTNDPFMGRMIRMIDRRCAFLSPAGPFCGAYAIRPYRVTRKMIAAGACHWVGYEKRGVFTCPCVGAYCIRPTNDPPKEGESPAFGRGQAFAIHEMALCGAYAIRPYPDGRKMIAVGVCSAALPEK